MAEDRIDSIIDIAAIEAEVDATEKRIKELVSLIQSVRASGVSIADAKTAKEYADLRRQLDLLIKQTETASKTAVLEAKAREAVAKAAREEAKAAIETTKAKAAENRETEASAKAKTQDKKIIEQAIDDYYQLSKAYNDATAKAKQLGAQLGVNHPRFIEAAKDANDIGNVLKRIDASVGQFQRNVGNYSSAFNGLGMSFTQVARELPSLAINFQTFALAISNNLPMVADELAKARREIAQLTAEGKKAPSMFSKLKSAILSPQVGLSLLITGFTLLSGKLFNTGNAAEKNAAKMKKFNDELENMATFSNRALEDLSALKDTLDQGLTLESNRIKLTGDPSADLKIFDAAIKRQKEYIDQISNNRKIADAEFDKLTNSNSIGLSTEEAEKRTEAINKQIKIQIDLIKLQGRARNDLFRLEQERELKRKEITQDAADKASEDAKRRAKEAKEAADLKLQTLTEIQALELQRTIDFNTEIAENEEVSLYERLYALRVAKDAEIELIRLRAETEIQIGEKTKEEIELITQQTVDAVLRIDRKFSQDREAIKKETAKKILENEIDLQKKLEKVIEEGYQNFLKRQKDREKQRKEEADKLEDEIERRKQLEKELIAELTTLSFTFLTAGIERQKNALQEQLNQLEIQKAREIELAGGNADAIAVIEARAQLQREAIQRKQRELDVKKAQFDKAQAIARIVQETAVAVVSNLKNPSLIPLVIAIGAAQLATVLAQPIPKYKDGGKHRGGPMIVGDGGRSEGIVFPDGTVMKSPATSTLMDAPAGTVIHKDFNKMLFNSTMTKPVEYKSSATTADSNVKVVNGLKAVEKAIGKIPQQTVTVQNVLKQRIKYGHAINEHLTRNLGK